MNPKLSQLLIKRHLLLDELQDIEAEIDALEEQSAERRPTLSSCRDRGDDHQNCDNCPDGECGDNTNPELEEDK